MEYINKLPFVLSASMTIVIGFLSYQGTDTMQKTYAKMAVSIVVFYMVGIIIRKTLIEIYKDIEKKNEERREQKNKSNEKSADELLGSVEKVNGTEQETNPQVIDYRVED